MIDSSRTPEGTPSECPLCGMKIRIEFSDLARDAPCPSCGYLLWESSQLIRSITELFAEALGTTSDEINVNTRFADFGADSLDAVEMVMLLEEECDVRIPDDIAESGRTIRDLVRYILEQRRGAD